MHKIRAGKLSFCRLASLRRSSRLICWDPPQPPLPPFFIYIISKPSSKGDIYKAPKQNSEIKATEEGKEISIDIYFKSSVAPFWFMQFLSLSAGKELQASNRNSQAGGGGLGMKIETGQRNGERVGGRAVSQSLVSNVSFKGVGLGFFPPTLSFDSSSTPPPAGFW